MLHIPNLKVLQRAAPRLENLSLLYYNQTHGSLLAELWWVICRSQVLLECGYSPPKIWKLLPEWSQDLITGSHFPQIAFSPTLIEHDSSETRNDSVIVAYRPGYKPALWTEFCENVSVWTVCVDQPVPDWSALSPSLPPALSLSNAACWLNPAFQRTTHFLLHMSRRVGCVNLHLNRCGKMSAPHIIELLIMNSLKRNESLPFEIFGVNEFCSHKV